MYDTIAGLPMHPLLVHATEVVVPTAALVLILAAVWPRFRRWAGWAPLGLALASLVLVPLSTQSGEALEERVTETDALERHADLGEGLLGWAIGLVLVAAAMLAWDLWRRHKARTAGAAAPAEAGDDVGLPNRGSTRLIAVVLTVAAFTVGTGTIVQAVLVGHSGAESVWGDTTD